MPSKNTRKIIRPNCYYHVYNRGINKQNVFESPSDVDYLIKLFSRYLDPNDRQTDCHGKEYKKYCNEIEIQCYCIMNNHYHLLLWTNDEPSALSKLMQSVWSAYTLYYNSKYKRIGPLFQDRYKASLITTDEHLQHITRYIHLNPKDYLMYQYSSIRHYINNNQLGDTWLNSGRVLDQFKNVDYKAFLEEGQSKGLAL